MKPIKPQSKYMILIPILILTVACMCTPSGFLRSSWAPTEEIPTEAAVDEQPTATLEEAETPIQEPTAEPVDEPVTLPGLSLFGPHLLMADETNVWISDPDLTAIDQLDAQPFSAGLPVREPRRHGRLPVLTPLGR